MADNTYQPSRAYHRASDGALVIPSGNTSVIESGGVLDGSAATGAFLFAAGEIAAADLAANAVTTPKIAAGAVTPALLQTPNAANQGGVALWYRASYTFAGNGGAVGTIALTGATGIPSGATIMGGFVYVTTPVTSGGAGTVAVQIEAANDTVTQAAVSGAPWSTSGFKAIIPLYTAATMFRTTAARDISIVIGTAALTAGAFDVFVQYLPN